MKDYAPILNALHSKYSKINEGNLASYIPQLTKASPEDFALAIVTVDGKVFTAGATETSFTLQSTSKPFVYALALEEFGQEFMRTKVGVEPTGEAFNSIVELEKKTHRPYNPMINSGAIAVSSLIKDKNNQDRLSRTLNFFSDLAGNNLSLDEEVFQSEKSTAHRNRSIAHLLRHFDIIDSDIEGALDLYFKQCSILVNTIDLAFMAATLANSGVQPKTQKSILKKETVPDVLSLMFTCGMYDTSGEWAYTIGLPSKSGVSGGVLTVVPGKMGIATYSPLIDDHGHSVRGVKALAEFVKAENLNIFTTSLNR
jgi:glutaminase